VVENAGKAGVSALNWKVEHMFLGRFYHTIDDKGRLTVPARFRDSLQTDGAYVTQGFDKNLMVLPPAAFDTLSQRVRLLNVAEQDTRQFRRMLYSGSEHVTMDKAGRILIPQFLRQANGVLSDVVVVGNGDYFEICSPEEWEAQNERLLDAQANADHFKNLDLSSAFSG
jgi:MraZ protein